MTKPGRGQSRKRSGRSAKEATEAQLPELEPMDDLPELEPIDELPELEPIDEDDGPVTATCAESEEDGFDTVVTVDVPDLPKKEVADAVEGPLARIAGSFGELLRHRKVLVRFTGEGLVGSAVKGVVADGLAPQKPLLVVVKRGFGDETVHEGSLPTVAVEREVSGVDTKVLVRTGDCEQQDIPVAMAQHVVQFVEEAAGSRFSFRFEGGVKPDSATREALATALRDGGARSVAVGARVLFDRDLEDRVQCAVSGTKATITISLTESDEDIVDALSLVLPRDEASLDGKNVRFQFARESAAVQAFCVDFARNAGAALVEVGGADDFDIVWPPLVTVRSGQEVQLALAPNGRSRAAVLAAFLRESAEHRADTAGQDVVVDWPEDFALDAEAVAAIDEAAATLEPRSLACTIHGDAREPFVPTPVRCDADGDVQVVAIETEAGKPKELQRAIDRRLAEHLPSFKGAAVRIEPCGDAPLSRTLRENLLSAVADAGPSRLELSEDGASDVILPPMLAVTAADAGVTISCVLGDRDAAQQRRAVARELEGVEVALQAVTIADSPAAKLVAEHVMEQGASSVVLDGPAPMRVHPPLFEVVEKKGKQARFVIEPTGDGAMDARMVDAELPGRLDSAGMLVGVTVTVAWPGGGADDAAVQKVVAALVDKQAAAVLLDRGDGEPTQLHPEPSAPSAAEAASEQDAAAAPLPAPAAGDRAMWLLARDDAAALPLVVVGVAGGDDEQHLAKVLAELEQHVPRFVGRAVLLVIQRDGVDAPVRKASPLVQLLSQAVPQAAAATLVFRGPDAEGRDHFEAVHSTVAAIPVGATFADPRRR
ncbi:MAG: hypothetical protein VYA51_02250 [Planctomycetota bacterium]|nr:hypothetical protein [Planctomycetota bacterium]